MNKEDLDLIKATQEGQRRAGVRVQTAAEIYYGKQNAGAGGPRPVDKLMKSLLLRQESRRSSIATTEIGRKENADMVAAMGAHTVTLSASLLEVADKIREKHPSSTTGFCLSLVVRLSAHLVLGSCRVNATIRQVQVEAKIPVSQMKNGVDILLAFDIIQREPERDGAVYLNPAYVFRGQVRNYQAVADEYAAVRERIAAKAKAESA
jgi:hypothetical protein